MSSPATISHLFNMSNMSPSSPIDLTISPIVREVVIISSDTEEDINDPCNNNRSYNLPDNTNNTLGFDNRNIFNPSTRRSSNNNNQDSSNSNTNNYRLTGLGTNRSSSNRNTPTRPSRAQNGSLRVPSRAATTQVNLMVNMVNFTVQANSNRSAFHPYASTEVLLTADDIHYNSNSSGSSRGPFFESARTNTNNDIQILNTPPPPSTSRRRSPIPTTLAGHARDLDESLTLICASCNELLYEKLWALGNCGHVVCGSCVGKFTGKKKVSCPSCKKTVKTTLQLYV